MKFLRESSIISTFEEMYRANLSFPSFSFSRLFQHIPRTNVVEIKFPRESIIHVTRTTRPFILSNSSSRIFYCHKTQNLTFFFFCYAKYSANVVEIKFPRESWLIIHVKKSIRNSSIYSFKLLSFFSRSKHIPLKIKFLLEIVVDYTR